MWAEVEDGRKTVDLPVTGNVNVTELEEKASAWDKLQALAKEYYSLPMSEGGAAASRAATKKKATF